MNRIIVAECAKAQLRVATLDEDALRQATPGNHGTIEVEGFRWDMDILAKNRRLMSTIVAKIKEAAGENHDDVVGIGIVLSGAVDSDAKIVHLTHVEGDIQESYEEMLAQLQSMFPKIPIVVEHRSSAAAFAENYIGWRPTEKPNKNDVLFLTISGNVGAGIVVNGQVWRGTKGIAGQIGHLIIDPLSTIECDVCMQKGCASQLASGRALVRYFLENPSAEDLAAVVRYVTDATYTSEKVDVGYYTEAEIQNSRREINARAVLLAARESKAAREATEKFCRYLARLVEELAYVLDPSIVVLGGIAAARIELGVQLDRMVTLRSYAAGDHSLKVSRLGDRTALYGAALQLIRNGEKAQIGANSTGQNGQATP